MGKSGNVRFGLKIKLPGSGRRAGRFKSDGKAMEVTEADFQAAQEKTEVKEFLAQARAQEERLEKQGLIHS